MFPWFFIFHNIYQINITNFTDEFSAEYKEEPQVKKPKRAAPAKVKVEPQAGSSSSESRRKSTSCKMSSKFSKFRITVESFIFVGLKFRGFQISDKLVGI